MSERTILLVGCGHSRQKKVNLPGEEAWNGALVTIDMDPTCDATVTWDMENRPLPFEDQTFDEIHAYDSLEHWGKQGDWRAWFDEMAEYHRLLKPNGRFAALVPVGTDHFADPGHTRFFSLNHFLFLHQAWYDEARRTGAAVTDYRWYWKRDFKPLALTWGGDSLASHHLAILLEKA